MQNFELDIIEEILINGGIDLDNYDDLEKGISKFEAVCEAIDKLIINYNWERKQRLKLID